MNAKTQRLKDIASKVLIGVGIGFVVYIGMRNWEELTAAFSDFDKGLFATAVAAGVLGNLGIALLFRSQLAKHNAPISAPDAAGLFFVSQVTKYVPGKIWGIVYQASRVQGVAGSIAVLLSNIELLAIASATNVFIAIAILSAGTYPELSMIVLALGLGGTYYASKANPLRFARRYLGKKFGADNIDTISSSANLTYDFVAFWIGSCLFIAANLALFMAFFDFDTIVALRLISYLLLASAFSVLVVVMPAGIGVKEIVFLLIAGTSTEFHEGLLVTAAIVSRFWQITMEFTGAALLLALRRFFGKS